ncbi:MAG TPA: FkbM family methyltransferase [Vicinamibacterales bacterium]|nr:FkbM family methyltransferase [Vicinamibacterales bacterium]
MPTSGRLVLPWTVRAVRSVLRRLPRGRYCALSTIAPRRGRFVGALADDLGGARFDCDLSDQLSREVCFTGLYEPPVTRVFQQQLHAGSAAVDAGANWGYFTLVAAAAVGDRGRVISLEPDPRQYEALTRNVALNGFAHVQSMQMAAAAGTGHMTLVGYADTDANRGITSIATSAGSQGNRRFDVPASSLDDLTGALPSIDIVKIDVEGAEDLVIAGMRDGLASRRYRSVLLELHPSLLQARGVDPHSCIRALLDHGYRGWTIDATPAVYRRAMNPAIAADALLRPLDEWRNAAWPHLLWLC